VRYYFNSLKFSKSYAAPATVSEFWFIQIVLQYATELNLEKVMFGKAQNNRLKNLTLTSPETGLKTSPYVKAS
jgi:hypothetical protein